MMKTNKKTYILFILPMFLPFSIFFIIPFFMGFYYSLFDWNGISSYKIFVGMDNYIRLFSDLKYLQSIKFSLIYVIMYVIFTNILALILAFLLDRKFKGRNLLRALYFLPNVISPIIAGFVWVFIFQAVSKNIYKLTQVEFFNKSWLGDGKLAIVSIIIVAVWQAVGYLMVIYIAGLQSIDNALLESSSIDGANAFAKFRHITLPLLMPAITVNLFMAITQAFRMFDLNVALTNGGPGYATTSVALDIYKTAFKNNMMGYGSAKAIVLFAIVFTITIIQIKYTKSREIEV